MGVRGRDRSQLRDRPVLRVTADEVVRALRSRHPDLGGEWLTYAECFRIDFFAMHAWPSRKHVRVGYEIKVSRADFRSEMRKPGKRMNAVDLCNEFYFATPDGMVRVDEVPDDCGLVWVYESGKTAVKKKSPRTAARPFTDSEIVGLARFQLYRDGVADMALELSRLREMERRIQRRQQEQNAHPYKATIFDLAEDKVLPGCGVEQSLLPSPATNNQGI